MVLVVNRFIGQTETVDKQSYFNYFYADKAMNFSLVRKHLNQNCSLPMLFRKTVGGIKTAGNATIGFEDESQRIQHYTKMLMPLMFEAWMEVRPQQFGLEYSADMVISNEAAHTLKTILEIIERIYDLIQNRDADVNNNDLSDWFCTTFNKEFSAQIFVAFPYVQGDGHKGIFLQDDIKRFFFIYIFFR